MRRLRRGARRGGEIGEGRGGGAHHSALLRVASAHDGLSQCVCKAQQYYFKHLMLLSQRQPG